MKCFSGDSFSFFSRANFTNIPPTFLISCDFNKVFKDNKIFSTVILRPFIRYHGKNLDLFQIWCCFQFLLHCLMQTNQVIHFLFHIIFVVRIKQLPCTLYDSEILLFKFFIDACRLTDEMPIDRSFFLRVWHSANSLSISVTDWNLSWSAIQCVCL